MCDTEKLDALEKEDCHTNTSKPKIDEPKAADGSEDKSASKDSSTSSSSSEDELTAAFKKVSIEPKDDIVVEEKAKEKKHDEPKASEAIITRPIIKSILGRERIQKLADYIRSDECKNIIFMTGAGISTSAGIPDFRSPNTGLFSQLAKYDLPYPEAIFDISFFRHNPKPFFHLARELFPGTFRPTPSHYFMRMCQDKGKVLRIYTQNIDSLERLAGVDEDKLVEAHGSFHTGHCINKRCRRAVSFEWMKERVFDRTKPDNVLRCESCQSLVKPDITFYGEDLPQCFYSRSGQDFSRCDLLIVMGTSLTVMPFAGLVFMVKRNCKRLLINKEPVANFTAEELEKNVNDSFLRGNSDEVCATLAHMCGWLEDLNKLVTPVQYTQT